MTTKAYGDGQNLPPPIIPKTLNRLSPKSA